MEQSDPTAGGCRSYNATTPSSSRRKAGSGCVRPKKNADRFNLQILKDEYPELRGDLDSLSPKQAAKLLLKYAEIGRLACLEHLRRT